MARPPLPFQVSAKHQKELRQLLSGGVQQVRVVLRAVALLQLTEGVSAPQVSRTIPLTAQAIRKIAHRYREGGVERALYERLVQGQPRSWKIPKSNASSRWCAVSHPRGERGGRCDWWLSRR
jgi:hypothetical protein